jgi:integrase
LTVKLRRRKLAGGNVSLYLDIYQNGKRQYEFLGLYLTKDKATNKETLKLAESIRAKRQLEIQNSEYGFVPHFKKKANFVDYFAKLTSTRPRDDRAWHNTLKHLKDYTGGRIQFAAVTEQWLEEFKTYLVTKVSQNTAHVYFSKIKATLRRAVKDKILVVNPAERVDQVKKTDTERVFLTLAEIEILAQTPCHDHEVKRAFLFSCFTGLRLSDIRWLEWQNVKGDSIEYRQRKTKGFEYLHLPETARRILTNHGDPKILHMQNTKVFKLSSGTHLTKALRRWRDNAGIDKRMTFHTARHTFATLALTKGADLYTVSKLLGHKTIQATQIYAKIVDEKKKAAMELLPTIEVVK